MVCPTKKLQPRVGQRFNYCTVDTRRHCAGTAQDRQVRMNNSVRPDAYQNTTAQLI